MKVFYDDLHAAPGAIPSRAVCVLGNFDGVHAGHRHLMKENDRLARSLAGADRLAITFTPHPRVALGDLSFTQIYSDEEKTRLMEETGLADELLYLRFDEHLMNLPAREFFSDVLIGRYHIAGLCVGDDFHFGAGAEGSPKMLASMAEKAGIACRIVPRLKIGSQPVSSTRIRGLLSQGEVEEAGRLLGQPFFIEGTVSVGKQEGRRLKTPTINVLLDPARVKPRYGVYTSYVHTEKGVYAAVVNVGDNPTFGGETPRLEAHLLDFDGDLYGSFIRAELLRFLRPQRKFESAACLKAQLDLDIEQARAFFGRQSCPQGLQ